MIKLWIPMAIVAACAAIALAATTLPATAPSATAPSAAASMPSPVVAATEPAPSPTDIVTPIVLPRAFEMVARRNIFIKGEQVTAPDVTSSQSNAGVAPPPSSPQSNLLLSGVSVTDKDLVAFLEDVQAGKVTKVHVGDSVAMGRVTKITLDSIDYQNASGQVIHVDVGNDLLGGHVENGFAPATQPVEENPILRRMRERRMEEMQEFGGGQHPGG